MMEKIDGMPIAFDFAKLQRQVDLIVCDGPLLSHYSTASGDHYLFYWVDRDDVCNRWMIVRTTLRAIRKYVLREIPLYQVLAHPEDGFVWLTDLNDSLEAVRTEALPVKALPDNYLPDRNAMYEFENEDPLLQGNLDCYELNLPDADNSIFQVLIGRMGWQASPRKLSAGMMQP